MPSILKLLTGLFLGGAPAGATPAGTEAKDKRPFVAEESIVIQYFVDDKQVMDASTVKKPVRVVTSGLAKVGRPEFELIGIPVELNNEAALLLNLLAEYSVNRKALHDGDNWASRLPDTFVVAGLIKEVSSFGSKYLRLYDVGGKPDLPAKTAVTAMAVSRARGKYEAGEDTEAKAILKRAIAWFPGVETPEPPVNGKENINPNNNLAYFTLASWHEDVPANYSAAMKRSVALVVAELGSDLPGPVDRKVLEADAKALVEAIQAELKSIESTEQGKMLTNANAAPGVGFLLSPIVQLKGGMATLTLAMGPVSYRRYFYEGTVREQLRKGEVHSLAAEIFAKWVDHPPVVLMLSRDAAVDVYETGYRFEDDRPTKPLSGFKSGGKGLTHVPMLSRILAAVGRDLAAGLSLDEVRARWKLVDNRAALDSANKKLAALHEREDKEITEAYNLKAGGL